MINNSYINIPQSNVDVVVNERQAVHYALPSQLHRSNVGNANELSRLNYTPLSNTYVANLVQRTKERSTVNHIPPLYQSTNRVGP